MIPLGAVSVISAAALALEVLLVRLFSIAQWHHFAAMIISLALLGYGASGTFLTLRVRPLLGRFPLAFTASAALFGVTAPLAVAVAQRVPLNSLEVVWQTREFAHLAAVYLVLAIPFFCAGSAIGLALARAGRGCAPIYRADLVGGGVGAAAVIGLLVVTSPGASVALIGAAGLAAAAIAAWRAMARPRLALVLATAAAAVALAWPEAWTTPRPSPYKELSLALTVPEARVIAERSGPLAWLAVVDSPAVPFRHAPGLSLMARGQPPPQLGVFIDGGAMTPITRFDGRIEPFAYLDQVTEALPYHLVARPRVLVLGAGGGAEVLAALAHGATHVDAVELNAQMVDLVNRDFASFAGGLYGRPEVTVHVAEARRFVRDTASRYDVIQIALVDSFAAAAAGLQSLDATTLYTVEAFEAYLARLAPGGVLAITRWLKVPPRDGLRLFATAREALERRGIADAARHLALVHGWRTVTLLMSEAPLDTVRTAAIRRFNRERAFDVGYLWDMVADEANRYNVLDRPYLYEGARALAGEGRSRFLADYKFDVRPTTDDRPSFFHFLKWRHLPELLRLGGGGLALVEWGDVILLAALLQAALLAVVLILAPLGVWRRPEAKGALGSARVIVYFFALGLAFMFVEMAFIHRLVLFLGHPVYAVAAVLSAFLVFAGLGGACAPGLQAKLGHGPATAIAAAVGGIVAIAVVYLVALSDVLAVAIPLAQPAKVAVAIALIAPLAFLMGTPFPLGLARIAVEAPALVPWAWGINGVASVIGALVATLAAVDLGLRAVLALALGCYGLAAVIFSGRARPIAARAIDRG